MKSIIYKLRNTTEYFVEYACHVANARYLMTHGSVTNAQTQKIIDRLYTAASEHLMNESILMRLLGKAMFKLDARKKSFMINMWKIASECNDEDFNNLFMNV